MQLPGGVEVAAGIARDFTFKPVTGEVELAMAEVARDNDVLVATRVTKALCAALGDLGSEPVDQASVDALCVGDRQFLMQQLAAQVGVDAGWLVARCAGCDVEFDFHVEQARLPVKQAGRGYPYTRVETSHGACRFRVPTGADQRAVAGTESENAAHMLLLRCLVETGDGTPVDDNITFSRKDLELSEEALDDVAPQVTTQVLAVCPACGKENTVALSPYVVLDCIADSIVEEIHTLAWHYHWSELAILALPRQRRKHYLALIERTRRLSPVSTTPTRASPWVS